MNLQRPRCNIVITDIKKVITKWEIRIIVILLWITRNWEQIIFSFTLSNTAIVIPKDILLNILLTYLCFFFQNYRLMVDCFNITLSGRIQKSFSAYSLRVRVQKQFYILKIWKKYKKENQEYLYLTTRLFVLGFKKVAAHMFV